MTKLLQWVRTRLLWPFSPVTRQLRDLRRLERGAARYGFGLYNVYAIEQATLELDRLWHFTLHSGHLTRAYHAGRTVRGLCDAVTDQLVKARSCGAA